MTDRADSGPLESRRPTGAERARQRHNAAPEKLPRLMADPDGLLSALLDREGVEDIGTWCVFELDGKFEAQVKRADGEYICLPKRWPTAGAAVDYLIAWAKGRGIIPTTPGGALRQYVNPRTDEDRPLPNGDIGAGP